jgi:hypothetical protein
MSQHRRERGREVLVRLSWWRNGLSHFSQMQCHRLLLILLCWRTSQRRGHSADTGDSLTLGLSDYPDVLGHTKKCTAPYGSQRMPTGVRRTVGWKGWGRQVDAESASGCSHFTLWETGSTALNSPLELYCVQTFCERRLDRRHWIDRSACSVACRQVPEACAQYAPCYLTRTAYAQVGNTARFSHGLPPSVAIP